MPPESSAFSTTDDSAISRTIDVIPDTTAGELSAEQFEDFYDIQRTADEIIQGDYRRVALQFPDELLHDSVPIFQRLKARIGPGRDLYVLADTSYGSCCVDEVAAQHANADAMVHYGHACMSLTSRFPVIYVFGKKKLDIERCAFTLVEAYKSHTSDYPARTALLRHDVGYTHLADLIVLRLEAAFVPLNIDISYAGLNKKSIPNDAPDAKHLLDYSLVFYIGGESLSLTNLLMTHASCEVFSYDPLVNTSKLESSKTNKLLMRRYATVQKARDADVFGILVGTLGVASYLPLITYLRKLLLSHHKKSYTISVGKLTPSKLANFLEIECFVLVACPENSLIEAKDFFKPIVTPFELEIALGKDVSWTGRYVLDFDQVIEEGKEKRVKSGGGELSRKGEEESGREDVEELTDGEDPDQPQFSLVTGKYRHAKRYTGRPPGTETSSTEDSVVLRNQGTAVSRMDGDSAAAHFLQQRSYRGLEVKLGEDTPSVLEQGRSGIARGYQTDRGTSEDMKP